MDLTKVNFINSAKYLPPAFQQNEYYVKICSLIDSLISQNSKYFAYEEVQFMDAMNKYMDRENLSSPAVQQIIKEFGYQYILNILDLPESRMKNLIAYLALINMLKGSKTGLELVLSLLGFDFKLLEWFEDPIALPRKNTYALELTFVDMGFGENFFRDFRTFSREYVYPLLERIVVYFRFSYGRLYFGTSLQIRPKVKIYPFVYIKLEYGEDHVGSAIGLHPKLKIYPVLS